MNHSTPGLPVHHQLPEFTQTHVYRGGDAIQPSHPLGPLLLLPPIPPSIRVFSNESTLHMRWPKYWSFSFSISPSNEHPGLISFRVDWLDLLAVQRTLKSLPQHSWGSQDKNTEVVRHSLLQWTTFCQTSPPWPGRLGWPHTAWLSVTELDTAVVLWSDWLVFGDYGFSVSALWCPVTTPTILLGCLLPWAWGISLQLLQQSTAAAPYLGRRYLLTLNMEQLLSALLHPCSCRSFNVGLLLSSASPDLGRGGSSFPRSSTGCNLAFSVAAPVLVWGVASHGHTSAWSVAAVMAPQKSCLLGYMTLTVPFHINLVRSWPSDLLWP